jgi:competence protein ComEC
MLLMIVLLGMICRSTHPFTLHKSEILQPGCHLLRIEESIQKNKNTSITTCSVFVKENSGWLYKNKCIVYIRNRNNLTREGMLLMAYVEPSYIRPMHNPGAFNYAFQQHIKGLFYQASLDEKSSVELIGAEKRKFTQWMNAIREHILDILRKSLHDKETYGLAEAMMIGFRGDLDGGILNSYINTGVVHVIAISGMHLSLIFLLIDFFVRVVFKRRRKDQIGLFITIPLLWIFSLLTGSSASVVRSALMLTFLLISKAIGKTSTGMNSLLGSAFMLLAWSPWIIYDLGFQLSYLAVGSMMLFEKSIRSSIYTQNSLLTKGWEMISVTLAAQILTTPISIYHFHQFPILFLFTNLIAIPLSSLILLTEILLCILDLLQCSHSWIDQLTHHLISWLNTYISHMEHVPFGMIKQIHIGLYFMLLVYVFIFAIKSLLSHPNIIRLITTMIIFMTMGIVYQFEKMLKFSQELFIIPKEQQGFVFMHKKGSEIEMICSKKFLKEKTQMANLQSQLANYYWIDKFKIISTLDTAMILKINLKYQKENALYLITGSPPGVTFLSKLNISQKNRVIADATNKLWKIRIWETEAEKLLLRFHSVGESGPLVLKIPTNHCKK